MPLLDTTNRTLQVKIVYYGPGLSGKTTNLEQLSHQLDPARTGDLVVLETTGDRTLFFDWMPVDLGKIKGLDVKIQLYTVPGQVRYNKTRKRVLTAVDGIVFVADSQVEAIDQNRFSFQNLRENLAEAGVDLEEVPLVIQYNKRDLPSALGPEELASKLSFQGYPHTESVASQGKGILETLRLISRLTLQHVISSLDPSNPKSLKQSPEVPLDGEGLLEYIMAGEAAERAAQTSAPDITQLSPPPRPSARAASPQPAQNPGRAAAKPVAAGAGSPGKGADSSAGTSSSTSAGSGAVPVHPIRRKADSSSHFDTGWADWLEHQQGRLEEVEMSHDVLKELIESLQSSLPKLVEEKTRPLTDKIEYLNTRLGVAQQLLTTLGGRVAVLERRLGKVESRGTTPGTMDLVQEISRLIKKITTALDTHAQSMTSTEQEPVANADSPKARSFEPPHAS